jgi:heme exporter protein D
LTHTFYIYSSWGIAAVTVLAVVAYTLIENFRLQAELKRLEAKGIRRRSADPQGAQQ